MIIVNNKQNNKETPINIDHIIAVYPQAEGCVIVVPSNNYCDDIPCKESVDEVKSLIRVARCDRSYEAGWYMECGKLDQDRQRT